MNAIPKSIKTALLILGGICLNSIVAQCLLILEQHKTSVVGLLIWTTVYLLVGIGLAKRNKVAYWAGIVLSFLQLTPLIASWFASFDRLLGKALPYWYPWSLDASAVLGIGLFVTLCVKASRNFIFSKG